MNNKNIPLPGQPGNSKLFYGSELLLILFAAFLLAAAIPPKTSETNAVPVKVNLPATDQSSEAINTALLVNTDDSQITALLTISETPEETAVR